jgi:hypothetical protein
VPGIYPSGGPVVGTIVIWQLVAPSLDLLSPDIYIQDYAKICRHYAHGGQALVIPEQRRDELGLRRLWYAYGSCGALCAAPFGIDFPHPFGSNMRRHFGLLSRVAPYILKLQADSSIGRGFYFDDLPLGQPFHADAKTFSIGRWTIIIVRHGMWVPTTPGYGLLVQLEADRFLLVGAGYSAKFAVANHKGESGILSVKEIVDIDRETGELAFGRRFNGDETLHGSSVQMASLPSDEVNTFDIAMTRRSEICEVTLYSVDVRV